MNEIFYMIVMKTKGGKKLYLKAGKGDSMDWTFNNNDSVWFERGEDAEKFAKEYFKKFDKWFIEETTCSI